MSNKNGNNAPATGIIVVLSVICVGVIQLGGFWIVAIVLGVVLGVGFLVLLGIGLWWLFWKIFNGNRFHRKDFKSIIAMYDYKSNITAAHNHFYVKNLGHLSFESEGIKLFYISEWDSDDESSYQNKKDQIIQSVVSIDIDSLYEEEFGCLSENQLYDDTVYDRHYCAPVFIPYSEIKFKAVYLHSIGIIPHNYIHMSFVYDGREFFSNIDLTKDTLYFIKQFGVEVEGLESVISPGKPFKDGKRKAFAFGGNCLVCLSDFGISTASIFISGGSRLYEFIVLYNQIEKIIIIENSFMKIVTNCGHLTPVFLYKEQMLGLIKEKFTGEIIFTEQREQAELFFASQPIISRLANKVIINGGKSAYAEVFRNGEGKYFFIISVKSTTDSPDYWEVADCDDVALFDTPEEAGQSAEQALLSF